MPNNSSPVRRQRSFPHKDHRDHKCALPSLARVYRRHRFGDWNTRIIILEGGIRCNYAYCGDVAIEHAKATDKDVLFLGWCYFDMESGFTAPPVCAHAYSLSVKAANILMNNIFPCLSPVDGQVAYLCKSGVLTWGTVSTGKNYSVPYKTVGLIRQDFF